MNQKTSLYQISSAPRVHGEGAHILSTTFKHGGGEEGIQHCLVMGDEPLLGDQEQPCCVWPDQFAAQSFHVTNQCCKDVVCGHVRGDFHPTTWKCGLHLLAEVFRPFDHQRRKDHYYTFSLFSREGQIPPACV